MRFGLTAALIFSFFGASGVQADWIRFGDEDICNAGNFGWNLKVGATLEGLAAGSITFGTYSYSHSFPFSPSPGDFEGTDQIYVGSVQTAFHDGYSNFSQRINGPQNFTLNYSSLVPADTVISTFTLGIAADDFQRPAFGQPYSASVNGIVSDELTSVLNGLNQTGPRMQFFTIGLSSSLLNPNHIITLRIDQGGDGGDGWAVDFLTVGVTTRLVPEPASVVSIAVGLAAIGLRSWRLRNRRQA